MSIKNLLYLSYWFHQPYLLRGTALTVWVVGFLFITLVGLVALFLRTQQKESALRGFFGRLAGSCLTMGIFGLIWLFFRQQQIPFLALRFWLVIWLVIFVAWVFPQIWYLVKRVPQIRAENAARAARAQYLR